MSSIIELQLQDIHPSIPDGLDIEGLFTQSGSLPLYSPVFEGSAITDIEWSSGWGDNDLVDACSDGAATPASLSWREAASPTAMVGSCRKQKSKKRRNSRKQQWSAMPHNALSSPYMTEGRSLLDSAIPHSPPVAPLLSSLPESFTCFPDSLGEIDQNNHSVLPESPHSPETLAILQSSASTLLRTKDLDSSNPTNMNNKHLSTVRQPYPDTVHPQHIFLGETFAEDSSAMPRSESAPASTMPEPPSTPKRQKPKLVVPKGPSRKRSFDIEDEDYTPTKRSRAEGFPVFSIPDYNDLPSPYAAPLTTHLSSYSEYPFGSPIDPYMSYNQDEYYSKYAPLSSYHAMHTPPASPFSQMGYYPSIPEYALPTMAFPPSPPHSASRKLSMPLPPRKRSRKSGKADVFINFTQMDGHALSSGVAPSGSSKSRSSISLKRIRSII
ncbi:hypothetical protein NEOLI_001660 [Neolecta irregularis DAH-3]|uniref:Uncharacterized protein n=1 Tax=Neolecta irregularis (strain DAH-3) TaxID=1198029 RepID=A0A1U7LLY6_NEOID|nr:hypothetical protein NEOLI_001660 [Neolecta irregularis DAH-3]|eukprot:OLL23648.1 hypothetical protein NEOLI_001660 [Neolecta irregularis DAH-3]